MPTDNKAILLQANEAIAHGDYEGFLSFCTEDTEWTFLGDQVLQGKEAVRQYMAATYLEPPQFEVERLVAEEESVIALGRITMKAEDGQPVDYDYCDVWQFRGGKMASLKAFVIRH